MFGVLEVTEILKNTLHKHLDRMYSFKKTASFLTVGTAGQLSVVPVALQKQKMVVCCGGRMNSKAQVHFLTLPLSHSIN